MLTRQQHLNLIESIVNINEAFDKPYPYKFEKEYNGDYVARPKLDNGDSLSIHFFIDRHQDEVEIAFVRNGSIDLTNQGDQMRIFATVIAATREFLSKNPMKYVKFNAAKDGSRDSRANLYKRLITRFASQIGYKVDDIDERGYTVDFFLVRKEK